MYWNLANDEHELEAAAEYLERGGAKTGRPRFGSFELSHPSLHEYVLVLWESELQTKIRGVLFASLGGSLGAYLANMGALKFGPGLKEDPGIDDDYEDDPDWPSEFDKAKAIIGECVFVHALVIDDEHRTGKWWANAFGTLEDLADISGPSWLIANAADADEIPLYVQSSFTVLDHGADLELDLVSLKSPYRFGSPAIEGARWVHKKVRA